MRIATIIVGIFQIVGSLYSVGIEFMLSRRGDGLEIDLSSYEESRVFGEFALSSSDRLLAQIRNERASLGNDSYRSVIYDHPGILLDECTRDDCSLNRLKYPHVRTKVQEHIVSKFKNRYPDTNRKISLASFGCGDLFQDFLLCSDLALAGYNLSIDLIDQSWKPVLDFFARSSFKDQSMIPASVDFLDEQSFFDNACMARKLAQLIQFRRLLPKKWSVKIYASTQDLGLKEGDPPYDCILGLDYGEPQYLRKTPLDFDELLLLGLKPKGIAFDGNSNIGCGFLYTYASVDFVPIEIQSLYKTLRRYQAQLALNSLAYFNEDGTYSSHTEELLKEHCTNIHAKLEQLSDTDCYRTENPLLPWLSRNLIVIDKKV